MKGKVDVRKQNDSLKQVDSTWPSRDRSMIFFFLDRNYLHLILEIMFWISRSGSSTQQDCKFNTWRDGGMAQAGNRAGKTEPYRWKQMNERKFHGRQ